MLSPVQNRTTVQTLRVRRKGQVSETLRLQASGPSVGGPPAQSPRCKCGGIRAQKQEHLS